MDKKRSIGASPGPSPGQKSRTVLLDAAKMKEMVVNFCMSMPHFQLANIDGEHIEQVTSCKYLGVHLDYKCVWSVNTQAV